MTFAEFQASKKFSTNLAETLTFYEPGECAECGNVYAGDLVIEKVSAHWPESAKAAGEWSLTIGNEQSISNDLADLEAKLFEYGQGEDMFS